MRRFVSLLQILFFAMYLGAAASGCVSRLASAGAPAAEIQLWDTQWVLPVGTGQYRDGDIDRYFARRRAQGFDVIMTGATQFGLRNNTPLLNGEPSFSRQFTFSYGGENAPMGDITAPNPAAWDYVGGLIDRAAQHGLSLALLPMSNGGSSGYITSLQTDSTAYSFGSWLGRRFAGKTNLIWVLGGDVCAIAQSLIERTNALAAGIRSAGARQPMTAHFGAIGSETNCDSSGAAFAGESWFDFSMLQSSVPAEEEIDRYIRADVEQRGVATGIGETIYEDLDRGNGFTGTIEAIRHRFFRTIFNGGFYFTYGHARVMLGCLTDECLKYGAAAPSAVDMLAAAKRFLNERGAAFYRRDESFISSSAGEVLPLTRGSAHMIYVGPGASAFVAAPPSAVRIYDLARDLGYSQPAVMITDGTSFIIDAAAVTDDALVTVDPVN